MALIAETLVSTIMDKHQLTEYVNSGLTSSLISQGVTGLRGTQ